MKVKYQLIHNTIEVPDDIFDDGIDENLTICEFIMEHFQQNYMFEIVEDNRKDGDKNK